MFSQRFDFNDYDEKIDFTIKLCSELAQQFAYEPSVRQLACDLTATLAPRDHTGEFQALHAFVRDEIRFIRDTSGVELVQSPDVTTRFAAGDCDDKSTLLASLLLAIGFTVAFAVIKTERGRYWAHIYVEVQQDDGEWIPLETVRDVEPGDEAEYIEKVRYVLPSE